MPYRTLDPALILETARRLEARVAERFPDAGLRKVAAELSAVASETAEAAASLSAPVVWLRLLIAGIILAGAVLFSLVGTFVTFNRIPSEGSDLVQVIEAFINTVVLSAVGLFALVRVEEKFKRRRAFRHLHGLRSLIHIIDMHQLTKDPAALRQGFRATAKSPKRAYSREELLRYLDYCSEMLSLCGKLAALYAQAVADEVVVDAVNDIEELAANLSRKIWQKIAIIGEVPGTVSGRPSQ
jgi:hypothetical protein